MPASYHIHSGDPSYLHISLEGRVTIEGCFENYMSLVRDEAFHPTIPTLVEIGPEAFMSIGDAFPEQIDAFGEAVAEVRQGRAYRLATAAGPTDMRSFLAMGQNITEGSAEHRTFKSVLEAREWILAPVGQKT